MTFQKGKQYWKLREQPTKYTPEMIEQGALDYFTYIDENPLYEYKPMSAGGDVQMIQVPKARPYTITGLCLFIGVNRRYFNTLAHHEDFKDLIERIKDAIYTSKFEGAAVGLFNANLISRDLGLADRQQVELDTPPEAKRLTLEDFYSSDEG